MRAYGRVVRHYVNNVDTKHFTGLSVFFPSTTLAEASPADHEEAVLVTQNMTVECNTTGTNAALTSSSSSNETFPDLALLTAQLHTVYNATELAALHILHNTTGNETTLALALLPTPITALVVQMYREYNTTELAALHILHNTTGNATALALALAIPPPLPPHLSSACTVAVTRSSDWVTNTEAAPAGGDAGAIYESLGLDVATAWHAAWVAAVAAAEARSERECVHGASSVYFVASDESSVPVDTAALEIEDYSTVVASSERSSGGGVAAFVLRKRVRGAQYAARAGLAAGVAVPAAAGAHGVAGSERIVWIYSREVALEAEEGEEEVEMSERWGAELFVLLQGQAGGVVHSPVFVHAKANVDGKRNASAPQTLHVPVVHALHCGAPSGDWRAGELLLTVTPAADGNPPQVSNFDRYNRRL